jgi:hypothetical protein
MAINKTPTTLGNLEFSDIKKSLTDYLKNQSVFSGYNFEGSAMQSVIDLLAYNTFYYAYYANMINAEAFLDSAQKEDSLISLCKPLGYTVPSSTSPKARITVNGISNETTIPEGTAFFATNSQGIQYTFFNLEEVGIDGDGNTDEFDIYEAKSFVGSFDAFPTFDFDVQKIVIVAEDFDLSTLKVTITEDSVDYVWTRVDNVGYVSQTDERIYFVERTSNGFAIVFGSRNSLGKDIDPTTTSKILVRYITTNGSDANSLPTFTLNGFSGNYSVVTISQSSGGRNKPDPSTIRFVAPKWFASQERAVTVNDYKALLIEAGFFEDETQFNVFGGQSISPPKYGRVFITSNIQPSNATITEFINFLKERSVITVLPEYVISNELNVNVDFKFKLSNNTINRASTLTAVKSKFNSNFAKTQEYNVTFSASDFITFIQEDLNNALIISPDDFEIYVTQELESNKEYTFNLNNELYLPISTYIDITEPFDCSLPDFPIGTKGVFKIYATSILSKGTKLDLQLWSRNETTGEEIKRLGYFGYFIASTGVINIKSGIIDNTANLIVNFAKKNVTIGLNNLVTLRSNNVTLI